MNCDLRSNQMPQIDQITDSLSNISTMAGHEHANIKS